MPAQHASQIRNVLYAVGNKRLRHGRFPHTRERSNDRKWPVTMPNKDQDQKLRIKKTVSKAQDRE